MQQSAAAHLQLPAAMFSANLKDQDELLSRKYHWHESPLQRL
jgi:hypothetical protein